MPPSPWSRAAAQLLLVCSFTVGCDALAQVPPPSAVPPRTPHSSAAAPSTELAWPHEGQASYSLGGRVVSSPDQQPVPIASLAKVMTGLLVVERLTAGAHVVVDAHDVADTHRRAANGESVVAVAKGEALDRHQALTALLLPSANNVAMMLADRVAGSRSAFVALMNDRARALGMTSTTYTDPSGVSATTVSTARDQVVLLRAALRFAELRRVMGSTSAFLPVAGRVRNTNTLVGRDGFVAGKTGSMSAAGGCLVFRVVRNGQVMDGAVLGQQGGPLIAAGLRGASDLAHEVLSS